MKRISPLLVLTLCLFPIAAFAAQDLGIADSILDSFKAQLESFVAVGVAAGKTLFFLLLTLEITRYGYVTILKGDLDIADVSTALGKMLLIPLTFFGLLTYSQEILSTILQGFVWLAGQGLADEATDAFSPSTIMGVGIEMAMQIPSNAGLGATSWFTSPLITLTALVAMLALLAAFCVMGAQLMMAYVEFYIVMTAAPIYLAFGSLAFTRDWATKVFSHAVATGTKIMVCGLLGMVMIKLGRDWTVTFQSANFFDNPNQMLEILGGAILLILMAFFIPSVASAIMSGNTSLGAGSAITSTIATMAGVAGAAAVAAGSVGKLGEKMGGGSEGAGGIAKALAAGQSPMEPSSFMSDSTPGPAPQGSDHLSPQAQANSERDTFEKARQALGGGSGDSDMTKGDASKASIGPSSPKKVGAVSKTAAATSAVLDKGAALADKVNEHVVDDRASAGAHVDLKG